MTKSSIAERVAEPVRRAEARYELRRSAERQFAPGSNESCAAGRPVGGSLQSAIGNRGVQRILGPAAVQRKRDGLGEEIGERSTGMRLTRQSALGQIPMITFQQNLGNRTVMRLFQRFGWKSGDDKVARKCNCGATGKAECAECSKKRVAARSQAEGILQRQAQPGQGTAAAQQVMTQADAARKSVLQKAQAAVRQLQIACAEKADPNLMVQALPDQVRAFMAWIATGPSDDDFCDKVALVASDISKNLSMDLPPLSFVSAAEMADPNEICNINHQFPYAFFQGNQIRICPKLISAPASTQALTLIHEMFHEPSFAMSHDAPGTINSAHCHSDSNECVGNPYCVTNVIGDLGGGGTM